MLKYDSSGVTKVECGDVHGIRGIASRSRGYCCARDEASPEACLVLLQWWHRKLYTPSVDDIADNRVGASKFQPGIDRSIGIRTMNQEYLLSTY